MRHFLAAVAFFGLLQTTQAFAQNGPVVIELYTSQGCSSCPPADAMLHDLAKRDDVIALALHVDYWDYIGWKDSFAQPAFTARQHDYARAVNSATVYTPQMVIGGVDHVIGSRPMQVMDTIQAHSAKGNPVAVSLTRQGERVRISAQPGGAGDYVVQLVRYTPEETVAIRRGENAGRNLSYANIVTSWTVLDRWDGQSPLNLVAQAEGDAPVAVIIQQATNGPVVGAAQLR
ncbi:DUF1223 domain-containing protein [Cognatiyoonia sp. IB215446]|uniref:DUF1223 domain-containing protein n=1 Tax=Cognatiyoonia sp. IB215446 TaxID=3097355 RepID=UPI002A164545|nr:DUF1223 domain-containing protein [Cognatiyoonia sp. IB215446]MDX8349616.1 DUF1223 domain-containing protein [Cognatiyoonia sp. IB215446]